MLTSGDGKEEEEEGGVKEGVKEGVKVRIHKI